MTWTAETSCGFESRKIAPFVVPYVQGKCLDIGCGIQRCWPGMIGIDSGHHFGAQSDAAIMGDGTDLSLFADASLDAVLSSHTLEHIPPKQVPAVLAEWWRVIRPGGYLVLYLPHADLYPRMGELGANPDHKADYLPDDVIELMKAVGSWTLVENETRGDADEYSFFQVYRKEVEEGHRFDVWQRNPDGRKRVLVCRFGAIGDQIVASCVFPGLHAQGYHITYMCTPQSREILRHNPHIDAWWVQATDYVPNEMLGPYWDAVRTRFDRFVNLSESIEGALLTMPGRLTHAYADEVRRKLYGHVNYLERTAELAGVPHDPRAARFYASEAELLWARDLKRSWGDQVFVWAIHGSSPHKVYPWTDVVTKWLLDQTSAHVVLLADAKMGKQLQRALCESLLKNGADMSRVHAMGNGAWTIRQALAFCQVADCVIGPETGPLNAVAMETMPKVIYLSHSSHTNLTRDWRNATVLQPNVGCYPCHRLHYDWTYCPQDPEVHSAACAASISPKVLFQAIIEAVRPRRAA